jgi:glycosyltransferase involved in cell wall biosynthesis
MDSQESGINGGHASRPDVSCFIPDLGGGGAQRAVVKLVRGLAGRGLAVDLVLLNQQQQHAGDVDSQARVIDLATDRVIKAVPKLVRYLRRERPGAVISFLTHANVAAVAACALAVVETRLIVVEQNTVSAVRGSLRRDAWLPALVRRAYPRAYAVVAVSEGVASDLVSHLGIPAAKVSVIHNPVVDDALVDEAAKAPGHLWFTENSAPVFVAVGRLNVQKDFPTLLRAFRMLRKKQSVRLLILGEGEERARLEALITELRLTDDVALPGFSENPYACLSRAAAFVLSSRWEGLPTVLIEALACGCPVIATDCPSGPREILCGGDYGTLVPVGDVEAMSEAMGRALEAPRRSAALTEHASRYSVERAVSQYLGLLDLAKRVNE